MEAKQEVKPRFIAGTVMPAGADRLPNSQPQPLLPPDVLRISTSINIADYTTEDIEEGIAKRYWPCVDELLAQGAQSITLVDFHLKLSHFRG